MLGLGLADLPAGVRSFSVRSLAFLATSDIDVGELLTQRVDHVDEVIKIGRSIGEFRENAAAALTDKRDRITAAWSMGQYFHPDTAYELFVTSITMICGVTMNSACLLHSRWLAQDRSPCGRLSQKLR
jgi:hypothetical protein